MQKATLHAATPTHQPSHPGKPVPPPHAPAEPDTPAKAPTPPPPTPKQEPGTEHDVEVKDHNGDRLMLLRPSKEAGNVDLHMGNFVRTVPHSVLHDMHDALGKALGK